MRPSFLRVLWPAIFCLAATPGPADTASLQLEYARDMLHPVREKIREEYYDPAFTGIDFEGIFRAAERQMADTKTSSEAYAVLAQAVINLGDSHTRFIVPPRPVLVRYGWALHTVGQNVHVLAVKPGSDAEKQGVLAGERVLAVNGMPLTRETRHLIRYLLLGLNPQPELRVQLQAADGTKREVVFASEVKQLANNLSSQSVDWSRLSLENESEEQKRRSHFHDLAPGVLYWKLAGFTNDDDVSAGLRKCAGYEQIVLDLRGNGGGYESTMLNAIGAFFDRKLVIGTLKRRHKTETFTASSRHEFKAKLRVLVDGDSASAAEVFARVMQLEGRGTVLGDRSSGHVNRGVFHSLHLGTSDRLVLFGVTVTDGALLMKDGQPLEKVGVSPDVWLVPSPKDIAAGNDPVLAAAAKLAGVTLTKAEAGAISKASRQNTFD